MNWQAFKTHGEAPETAFEAFVTLLFEGWCRLEAVVDRHGREIANLRQALVIVNARVDAVQARLTRVESDVECLKHRVTAIEKFLSNDLSDAEANNLLRQVAPILLHDEWESGPLVRPIDFVEDAAFNPDQATSPRLSEELRRRNNHRFDGETLAKWLQQRTGEGEEQWYSLTDPLELIPRGLRRRGLGSPERSMAGAEVKARNKAAIESHVGVFGAVAPLPEGGAQLWSVKYFWLHAWNETAFPDGEGNHEGDWGCVDLTVNVPFAPGSGFDIKGAKVVDAIIHEHGHPHRFSLEKLDFDPERKRLLGFLNAEPTRHIRSPAGPVSTRALALGHGVCGTRSFGSTGVVATNTTYGQQC